jgi:hypothetical protein
MDLVDGYNILMIIRTEIKVKGLEIADCKFIPLYRP